MSQDSNFEESVTNVSRIFDGAIRSARKAAGRHDDIENTNALTEVSRKGDQRSLNLRFTGENAPVIARPIQALMGGYGQRQGSSGTERSIIATITSDQLNEAASRLKDFEQAAKRPGATDSIEAAIKRALTIETALHCKVVIKFDIKEGAVSARTDYIITECYDELALKLRNKPGIRFEDYGQWTESDMKTRHESGVLIRIMNEEGQSSFTDVSDALLQEHQSARALPAADDNKPSSGPERVAS